jgi:hypothetical protein
MVFELPSDLYYQYDQHQKNGQSALLQAVRTSMRRTYSSSEIGGDGQFVVVNFTDGISVEVVPVFENKAGAYTYPDSNGGGTWKTTNPRAEIKAVKERNDACNRNLVPLCRMMRAWKKQWDVPIGGLLIDTLAYQFIENHQYRERTGWPRGATREDAQQLATTFPSFFGSFGVTCFPSFAQGSPTCPSRGAALRGRGR